MDITKVTSELNSKYQERRNKVVSVLKKRPDVISKIKQVYGTPAFDELDSQDQEDIFTALRYAPEFFEEPKEVKTTLTPLQKKQNSTVNTIEKLGLTGIVKNTGQAVNTAIEKGYLPDIRDNNLWGALKEGFAFPLTKILEGLNTGARTEAELVSQAYKKGIESGEYPTVDKFKFQDYNLAEQAKKNFNPLNALKTLDIGKEGWNEVAKAAYEPLIKTNSKYAGTGFTQTYEEMFGGTKAATPFSEMGKVPEEWKNGNAMQKAAYWADKNVRGDEEGNWWQRLISGFAGTPLDVAGLASDIAFDPLTYVSGGLGKGAKTGVSLVDDLIKDGMKVLPKGAEVGLTKAGREAYKVFEKTVYPNIFKAIDEGLITPSAVIKGLNGTDDAAKTIAKSVLTDRAINKFIQEVPDAATTYKYLDLGGTKIFGETLIPGYKYAQAGEAFEKTRFGKWWQQMFNAQAGIPKEFRNIALFSQASAEADVGKLKQGFADIITNTKATDDDLKKVQQFFGIQADIERTQKGLDKAAEAFEEIKLKYPDMGKIKNTYKKIQSKTNLEDLYSELGDINTKINNIKSKIGKETSNISLVSENTKLAAKNKLQAIEDYITDSGGVRYTIGMKDEWNQIPFKWRTKNEFAGGLDEVAQDIGRTFPELGITNTRTFIETLKDLRKAAHGKSKEVISIADDEIEEVFKNMFFEDFSKQSEMADFAGFKKGSIADLVTRRDELSQEVDDLLKGTFKDGNAQDILDVIKNKDIIKQYTNSKSALTKKSNLLTDYNNYLDSLSLTDKQLDLANKLKDFAKKVNAQFEAAGGKIEGGLYDWYAPIRYKNKDEEIAAIKKSLTGSLEQSFEKSRVVPTKQAEALGLENKDLITSWNQRLWEQENSLKRSRLIDGVKQFGSETSQPGMVKINNIPELKNFYMPQEYADMFKRTYKDFFGDQSFSKMIKAYDKGLTIWKKLALFTPGYDIRNFITDGLSGLMQWGVRDYFNPSTWNDMRNILQQKHVPIKMYGGEVEFADDIYKKLVNNGTVNTTQTAIEAGLGTSKKISAFNWKFNKISNPRENMGRVVGYLIERKAGASDLMSSAVTKNVFFDYLHSMTKFDKNIGKRFINPFWSWQKNNLKRQFELLFTRTGEYAAIPKVMNFVENITDLPEGYKEFKEDYQKDLGMFGTPLRQPGLPDFAAELLGRPKTTKAGKMLSYNPNQAFQDWSRLSPQDAASSLPPNIKIPLELLFDKNLFSGGKTRTGDKKEASKPLAAALKVLPEGLLSRLGIDETVDGKVLIPPAVSYLLSQLPQYALTQRGFAGTENSPYQNISALLGVKFTPYNEDKAKEDYIKKWNEQASQLLSDYENKNFTKEQIDAGEGLPSTTQIKSAYKEMYETKVSEKYAEVLQLKELLEIMGSNNELDAYIKEMLEPYYEELDKAKGKDIIDLKKLLKDIGIEPELIEVQDILAARKEG